MSDPEYKHIEYPEGIKAANAILNRSVGWKANGEFFANPMAKPTLDDIFLVEEAAITYSLYAPPLVGNALANYSEALNYDKYKSDLLARRQELESVELNCTTCGEPITSSTVLICNKCKTSVRWISNDSSIAILSLQRQLYSLAEQMKRREHRKLRGYTMPIELFLDGTLPNIISEKQEMLLLEIKSRINDKGKEAVKKETLSCPACAAPLLSPHRCSHCQSLIVYTDVTFDVLDKLNDLQLNTLIAEKQEFLTGCAQTLAYLHSQIEIGGGKEYAPQSKVGEADIWEKLFEETRVVLNNALIINRARGNGMPLIKALQIPHGTEFKEVRPADHLDAQALIARCVSCAGGIDSIIGKPQREIADIFECKHCGALQDFGGLEVTQKMISIVSEDIRSQLAQLSYCLAHYQNTINSIYKGDVQAFYNDEKAGAIAGPHFDQSTRYPRFIADANRVFASINKYKGRNELPVAVNPQFSLPSEKPPQGKKM